MNAPSVVDKRQLSLTGSASILACEVDLYDLLIILYLATAIAPLLFQSEAGTLQLDRIVGLRCAGTSATPWMA